VPAGSAEHIDDYALITLSLLLTNLYEIKDILLTTDAQLEIEKPL
jgi:hypothetical protein